MLNTLLQLRPDDIYGHDAQFFEEDTHATPEAFYSLMEAKLEDRALPGVSFSRTKHREGAGTREYLRISRGAYNFDIGASPFGKGLFFCWWLVRRPFRGARFISAAIWIFLGLISLRLFAGSLLVGGMLRNFLFFFVIAGALFIFGGALVVQSGPHAEDRLYDIPFWGPLWATVFNSVHYFRADTAAIFEAHIKILFEEAYEEITSGKGLRGIAPPEPPKIPDDAPSS